MDTITQGLLGAATSQLGFRQRIGRDAGWVAAAAAIVPDLDIFVTPLLSFTGAEVDGMTRMTVHRGLSHSLLMVPLLSLPIAILWWWFRRHCNDRAPADRPPPFGLLYACVFVAILSHPLLDWCTSYGTQLFAPLARTRFAADAVGIIDVIYTPMLIATLLGSYIARKLARLRPQRASLIAGIVGFALSTTYLAAGWGMGRLAIRKAVAATPPNGEVVSTRALPAIGTIFLWRVVVETEDAWHVSRIHHLAGAAAPPRSTSAQKQSGPWIRRARQLEDARTFKWFAMGLVRAAHSRHDGEEVVELHDMRYGLPLESIEGMWGMSVHFDASGTVRHIESIRHRRNRRRMGGAVRIIWTDIWQP